jgi:serine protease AprX
MESEKIQLIIEHTFDESGEEYEKYLLRFCEIKYRLPLLGVIAVELDKNDLLLLQSGDVSAENERFIYSNAVITTQAKERENVFYDNNSGYTGKGIGIAILDTGIAPLDDFTLPSNRIAAFVDIVNSREEPYDDNAHGTHVAGIAAGNGHRSDGKISGVAVESHIVAVKVLDGNGKGNTADVLAGIEWMIKNKDKYNIRVANLSIGVKESAKPIDGIVSIEADGDPLVKAVEIAWDAGIVVCAAAGNNGPAASSVTSPGVSKKAITVGACDDEAPSDMRANFSGRGPTLDCVIKPDCLAPGADVISCLSNSPEISDKRKTELRQINGGYTRMSGTSMSSPYVAGSVALLLQKCPELSPDDVKLLVKQCCLDIHQPQNRQGWGLFDLNKIMII